MTRYGDYIVFLSMTLNASACLAYLWQGQWHQALYWIGALIINASLVMMK